MIKILFSDLDGTLLKQDEDHTKGISEENKNAIKKLQSSHIQFAIATGRSIHFLQRYFGDDYNFDTVALAGAKVKINNQIIYHSEFDNDETLSILATLKESGYNYEVLGINHHNDYIFQDFEGNFAKRYLASDNEFQDHNEIYHGSLEEYSKDKTTLPLNCLIVFFNSPDEASNYQQTLRQRFMNEYAFIRNGPRSIIIAKDGANKGTGIFRACQTLSIDIQNVACVGDSDNDIEMFEMIPTSFCMSHAPDHVKAKAKYIVDSVYECIDKIIEDNQKELLSSKNIY